MTQIDITGPDGNAFSLIGYAKTLLNNSTWMAVQLQKK